MKIKNIVVVGGGATGWTVASFLAKQLPRELVKIQVVEEKRKDNECVEFARSAIHRFHDLIGLHEKQCVLNDATCFGLGVWCQGLHKDFILVEGAYGAPLDGIDFQSVYYKSALLGSPHQLDDYSLSAVAARLGRFGHPVADSNSIYSSIQYGINFELDVYADVLRAHALALGVEAIQSDCKSVNVCLRNNIIDSIELANGQVLAADLFIDCSGEQSILMGEAMKVFSVEDNLDKIFDSMAAGYRPLVAGSKPVTQLINTDTGYLRIIPLKHQEYICHVYSSKLSPDDHIKQKMLDLNVSEVVFSTLNFKKKEVFWVKNCVAMGHAGACVPELFVSPLSLVRNAVVRLLDLLTGFDDFTASAFEYNRLTHVEFKQLRELTELYFYLSKDSSSALREYFKQHELSVPAQHRLDLFTCSGRHPYQQGNIFSDFEWAAFFVGNQLLPLTCNLDVDVYDKEKILEYTERLSVAIYKAAERMPMHADYVARLVLTQ